MGVAERLTFFFNAVVKRKSTLTALCIKGFLQTSETTHTHHSSVFQKASSGGQDVIKAPVF